MDVLQTGIMLKCPPKGHPGGHQYGDVAKLASGRLVARCRFDFGDGTAGYACRTYDPGEKPEAVSPFVSPKNWGRWIDDELNRHPGRYRGLGPRDYDTERAELARFRGSFPHIFARLAEVIDLAVLPTPATLFDLGPVLWANLGASTPEHEIDWRGLADQHAAGKFGLFGEYDSAPLTDEQLWTLPEQPVVVGNRAAIAVKAGAVRSRYLLPSERSQDATKLAVVEVVTVLSPTRGPRTMMSTAYVDRD